MTINGTLANLNAALNGLIYTPASNYTGSDTLTLNLTNSGDGLAASASVAITVRAPKYLRPRRRNDGASSGFDRCSGRDLFRQRVRSMGRCDARSGNAVTNSTEQAAFMRSNLDEGSHGPFPRLVRRVKEPPPASTTSRRSSEGNIRLRDGDGFRPGGRENRRAVMAARGPCASQKLRPRRRDP